jgi:hypothetical protein
MNGTQWLELLCRHIPDRYEHLVRYLGWYSNRSRGERAKKTPAGAALPCGASEEPASEFAARAKAAWARLIRKVYEADPIGARGAKDRCGSIEEPEIIRRILEHLGRWAPEPAERDPPRASSRVAGQRRHPAHLPRSPQHRVTQREVRASPAAGLVPCDCVTPGPISTV